MWATAEKVVPRSIPTALRWFMGSKRTKISGQPDGRPLRQLVQFPCRNRDRSSIETLGNDFFGPDQFPAPGEAAAHTHDDASIFFRVIGRLKTDNAMNRPINPLLGLDFLHFESVQNLDERMDRIFQIIAPLDEVAAFAFLLRRTGELFAQTVQVIEEQDE